MANNNKRITNGQGRLYDSIIDTIGNTPCIRINKLAPEGVRLYVKVEAFNPAASVKDRLAISIIEEAEKRGDLKPGQTVVSNQREYWDWSCDGVCDQRLSLGSNNGG